MKGKNYYLGCDDSVSLYLPLRTGQSTQTLIHTNTYRSIEMAGGKKRKLYNYETNGKQDNSAVILYLQWCLIQRILSLNDKYCQSYPEHIAPLFSFSGFCNPLSA